MSETDATQSAILTSIADSPIEKLVAKRICAAARKNDIDVNTILSELAEYGCSPSVPEIVGSLDTARLYDEHKDDIWKYIIECCWAQDVFAFLSEQPHSQIETRQDVENLVAWTAFSLAVRELYSKLFEGDE